MNWKRDIEVLTPLFNRGAYQDTPEIRVPSIRGMVRWWFRALGGTADEEKQAFGGMKGFGKQCKGVVMASRLVFRISNVHTLKPAKIPTLPHKKDGEASPQFAFPAGAKFKLIVFSRFGDLQQSLQNKVENALEVWLLLGALGFRANRGGGNVWPADGNAPKTETELRQRLNQHGCHWPVMVADLKVDTNLEALRKAATDTKNGLPDIFGTAAENRQASKVKFKIVRLEDKLRLLITAPTLEILNRANSALQGKPSKPETWTLI